MQPWVQPSSWGSAGTGKNKALKMLFANITKWGKTAERFFDEHRMSDFHSIAVAETHLAAPDLRKLVPRLHAWGRRGFGSAARATGRSEAGTSGGVLVAPALALQLDSLSDPEGSLSPWRTRGHDWVCVPIRLRGLTFVHCAAYMTACVGPRGENITKLKEMTRALLSYRLPMIVVADWNMEPQELATTGLLDLLGVDIVTPRGVVNLLQWQDAGLRPGEQALDPSCAGQC